jgi:hypothetical protein
VWSAVTVTGDTHRCRKPEGHRRLLRVEDWAGGRDHRYKAGLDGCSIRTREKTHSLSRWLGAVQSQTAEC